MWAVYKHEVPAISLLLEKGANPAVQSTAAKYSHPTGSTAAAIAIEWDLVDAVEALEKGGCQAAKRYLDCLKSIYFIDPQTEKRPFRIMNLITITQSNGYDESVMKSLKIKACQAGADGLTIPERQMGPRNTTYTTKVIVWEKVQP